MTKILNKANKIEQNKILMDSNEAKNIGFIRKSS